MKRILSVVLSIILILPIYSLGLFNIPAKAATSDFSWTLDGDTLTISGKGAIPPDLHVNFDSGEIRKIAKIIIEEGITTTNLNFNLYPNLTSVTLPNGVTSIEDNTFRGCANLTNIVIPDSVTSIGICAFSRCSSLTSIVIPDSVTGIGKYAFSGCSSLTSITIHRGVYHMSIGDYAFSGCSSLTSITIPSRVKSFNGDFSECENLTDITISGSVSNITTGSGKLKKMNLPERISTINGDFSKCSGLVINYSGSRNYWKTIELTTSLERAILDGRAKVICADDNTVSSSTPAQTTPTGSSKPEITVSSKPSHSNTTSSKPTASDNTSSKTAEGDKTSSTLTQSSTDEIESGIITESEPTSDTISENISSQISDDKGGVSPIAIILIAVGAVVLGAGVAVGIVLFLKKKNKF